MADYFSTNLKHLREQKGLSQTKLADKIGVNQTTIARWEDDNRVPTIDNAIDVSIALDVPLEKLLGTDLRIKNNSDIELPKLSKEEEIKLLKKTLKEKGFLNENEDISEDSLNELFDFAIANKKYIMKDDKK